MLPRPARTTLVAVSAILGVTLWSTEAMRYPGAFRLNVFVGNWIAVPIIVGLLIWLLRDLRSRIEGGGLFEDEAGLTVPALLEQPPHEERVAQPA